MLKKFFLAFALVAIVESVAWSGFSYTVLDNVETIDFAGYTGAGFAPTPAVGQLDSDVWAATGWSEGALAFGGTRTTAGDYALGPAAAVVTTGGFYAFSSTPGGSVANPSFGIQPGGSDWAPGTLTLRVINNTGSTILGGTVGFDLFVRNDQARSNSFNFSYTTGAPNADLSLATFTVPGGIDSYTSIAAAGAAGWTTARDASSLTDLILGSVAPGDAIFFRWSGADVGGSGSRDEFALDDVSFSFTAVPEPTSLFGSVALGLAGVVQYRRRRRSIS